MEITETNKGAAFLQRKYKLSEDPAVVLSARRHEQQAGKKFSQHDYFSQIQNYFDRLGSILNPPPLEGQPNFDRKRRNIEILKRGLYDQIIIKPEEVPDSYFQSIMKRQEEEGKPIDAIPEDIKRNLVETLIEDQKESLDIWINYLTSPDAQYPDWFKYYVFRSILVMGRYDKEKKKFFERSKTGKSVSQFPELIRDALSFVNDALEAKQKGSLSSLKYGYGIKPEEKAEFERLLKEGDPNFARLYAWAIDKITPISEELLQQTRGRWIKYPQGSDPKKVVEALAHYGTGWCIRGGGTASSYLESSDLEIYFSLDQNGQPTVPRIVIVTRGGNIDEVRGIAKEEHWDPYITDVVEQKLKELPDGEKFKKRVADMQRMTAIYRKCFSVDKKTGVKTYLDPLLSKEELEFLYEINGKIEGFGYQIPDPRITEVRSKRNLQEDMPLVLGCDRSQIAKNAREIREGTKAYVGPLEKGIFDTLSQYNVEQIYTSFPEGRIRRQSVEIGGKTKAQLVKELEQAKINISSWTLDMINNPDFTTSPVSQMIDTVRLKVKDLGLSGYPTISQIYKRAQELGLNICPAEVGPHLRLKDMDQPINEWYLIAMKQIADSLGDPYVFGLKRSAFWLWLVAFWAGPDYGWGPAAELVFSLRKYEFSSLSLLEKIFQH